MGFFNIMDLPLVRNSPFRLTPRNSPLRGFLLPMSGLCQTAKVQIDAQECTEWHESLPEPCRRFGCFGACQGHRDPSASDVRFAGGVHKAGDTGRVGTAVSPLDAP